jgi:hypothetical protein
MCCAPGWIIDGIEGVGSSFHISRSRARFQRNRGRQAQFSCFALPDPFSMIPRAPVQVFIFFALWFVFGGIGRQVQFSCFALRDPFSTVPRAPILVFMFCAPGPIIGGTVGNWSSFHVLCSRTRFRLYRGRRVSFSCFALSDPFSAVLRTSGPVFMFCAPETVFGVTEGNQSSFHVLLPRTRFRQYWGRQV